MHGDLVNRHDTENHYEETIVRYDERRKYRSPADYGKSVRGGRMAAFLEGKGQAVLAAMDGVAAETDASHAQIALAWLAAQPGVTAPIASATSVEQVAELAGCWNVRLTTGQLDRLTAAGA